ncbi:hypothetical protein ABT008_17605 [Micromonospora sp. NPDC002389]|uniref:hypothetical protein n=1 Tax=Micromonospora sp. NPDC002389 TaxID=3154272 RepID=UPI0033323796
MESPGPYGLFVEVLLHRGARGRLAAMVGEMIAVHAEVNHLLGRTKDAIGRSDWVRCSGDYACSYGLFESTWKRYAALVERELEIDRTAGRELGEAFDKALNGARASLTAIREQASEIGITSWE